MKKPFALLWVLLITLLAPGQDNDPPSHNSKINSELEAVLSQMDKAAANFKSAQAKFEWDNYQKVVEETEHQKGEVYFQRNAKNVEVMFDITTPYAKQVLFKDGKLILYDKKIDQITEHTAGKNRADVETFLSLGFGARGHDLLKSYQVSLAGWDTVDGIKTAKLELIPKEVKVRNMFSQFIIWLDLQRDVPIQQKVLQPAGDYWFSHYTDIKMNARISEDAFRIKTTPRTKVVTTQ